MKKIFIFLFLIISGNLLAQPEKFPTQQRSKVNFKDSVNIAKGWMIGGTIMLPSAAEINYIDGVTSAIQTQINLKANLASPTFTGTVTIPTPFTLGATSVTTTPAQFNYLNAATGTTGTTSSNVVYSEAPTLNDVTLTGNTQINDSIPFEDALFTSTEVYRPEDYGAVGDGVTVVTDELQAMFDAAKMGRVEFPSGIYLVDTTITIYYGTKIKGVGWDWYVPAFNGTIIKSESNYPILRFVELPGEAYQRSGMTIEDLCIFGNQTGASQDGIWIDVEAQMTFSRIMVGWCGGHGFRLGSTSNHVSKVYILNNTITTNEKSGIYGRAEDANQINVVRIENCNINSNMHGIDLIGLSIVIKGNNISNNDSCAINMYPYDVTTGDSFYSIETDIQDNYFENDPVYIGYWNSVGNGACTHDNITIDNNYFYMSTADLKGHTGMITLGRGNGSTTNNSGLENIYIRENNYFYGTAAYVDMSAYSNSSCLIEIPKGADRTKYLNTSYGRVVYCDQAADLVAVAVTATGIPSTSLYPKIRLSGLSGAVDITTNPQIGAGFDGETIQIFGYSNTNYLILEDGNGLSLNAGESCLLKEYDWITFTYSSTYSLWTEVGRSKPQSPVTVKKITIGTPGDAENYNFATAANSTEQVLTLTSALPAKCRITAVEIVCTETLAGSGTHEIVMHFGTTSSGEELIAATGAGTMDDANEVQGIIDATKPAAIQMNWASATSLYLTGDPDANWDTLTAGKWSVYITYMNYNDR